MGVKVDAIPGRLNVVYLVADIRGLYFGQCSEICGANHSFMPIAVRFVDPLEFYRHTFFGPIFAEYTNTPNSIAPEARKNASLRGFEVKYARKYY